MEEEKKTTEEVTKKQEVKNKVEKVEAEKNEKTGENAKTTEETKKKSGKKIIIITIITLFVVIAAAVGGYFAYDYYEMNKSVGTEWGDIYYSYLEEGLTATDATEQMRHGIITKDGMENTTIQFVNLDQKDEPEMIMNFSLQGTDYTNIYFKKEDNNIGLRTYVAKQDMKLLYNIEKQEYIYYAHSVNEKGTQTYISMPETLADFKKAESDSGVNLSTIYTFEEKDMSNDEGVKEGETPKISKFEETFIVPEVEESKKISVDLNADIKDIKNAVTETVEGFKPEEEMITEQVKTQIEEGKTELNNKKEEIRKAEEEKKRQEEEARKRAEEEAARKAAEEAAKGLKVGKYTLKYGKYTFSMDDTFSGKLTGTITLQPNGQFYIKSNFDESEGSVGSGLDCAGTYTVELNVPTGYPGDYSDGIKFKTNTGKTFFHEVISNTGFSDQWHGYTYAGN